VPTVGLLRADMLFLSKMVGDATTWRSRGSKSSLE
jgi:hypothetical protein